MSPVEALTQIDDILRSTPAYRLAPAIRAVLDAVSVDATPAQGIARDALVARLQSINWGNSATRIDRDRFWGECADAVLALVRPVEGVVLSPEEAADLAVAASVAAEHLTEDGWAPRLRALASRLDEASS